MSRGGRSSKFAIGHAIMPWRIPPASPTCFTVLPPVLYLSLPQIPTTFEFVDIAGLVRGASKGEGLGNQFLANIRETDAIVQVCERGEVVVAAVEVVVRQVRWRARGCGSEEVRVSVFLLECRVLPHLRDLYSTLPAMQVVRTFDDDDVIHVAGKV